MANTKPVGVAFSDPELSGGMIDNSPIGATTPSSVVGTTMYATSEIGYAAVAQGAQKPAPSGTPSFSGRQVTQKMIDDARLIDPTGGVAKELEAEAKLNMDAEKIAIERQKAQQGERRKFKLPGLEKLGEIELDADEQAEYKAVLAEYRKTRDPQVMYNYYDSKGWMDLGQGAKPNLAGATTPAETAPSAGAVPSAGAKPSAGATPAVKPQFERPKTPGEIEIEKAGEIERNKVTGEIRFVKDNPEGKVIGYLAFLELKSGFSASLYMTEAEIESHASRFSKMYQYDKKNGKKSSKWSDPLARPKMALKTVIKGLLGTYGLLSPELIKAFESDGEEAEAPAARGAREYPDAEVVPQADPQTEEADAVAEPEKVQI